MKEPEHNMKLVKSFLDTYPSIDCRKITGNQFCRDYPDIGGTYLGMSFYIEGKRIKFLKNDIMRLEHKFSAGQIHKMKELYAAGALVMIALYHHYNNDKFCILIPMDSHFFIPAVDETISYDTLREYRCNYTRSMYDIKGKTGHLWKEHIQRRILPSLLPWNEGD